MATNKIDRINREIEKTREKITEYQNKLKGLEAQKTEAENLQILRTSPTEPIIGNVRRQFRHLVLYCGDTPQRTVWKCWTNSFQRIPNRQFIYRRP